MASDEAQLLARAVRAEESVDLDHCWMWCCRRVGGGNCEGMFYDVLNLVWLLDFFGFFLGSWLQVEVYEYWPLTQDYIIINHCSGIQCSFI